MKKHLGIVVLGLLLSGNAYSKEIFLNCTSYNTKGFYKNGAVSDEVNRSLKSTFKINTKKQTVFEYNSVSNKFLQKKNINWNEGFISWEIDWGDVISRNEINRIDLTYIWENDLRKDPKWDKYVTYHNCKIGKKKF